jgi:homeobox protein cut-like
MQAMTKDNASLKATVNRLSNQITNLEASLNAKNKELERKEKEKEEEAQRVEEVWRGVLDEKTRNWEGKEKALTEKLEHQETVLKEIKASYEVAQRMGPTSPGAQDDLLGKERAAELEIVTRDLERTTLRLAEVEGRNEQLRLELEKASNQETTGQAPAAAVEDESTILRLQHESANLLRKVNNAKAELDAQKKESERKTRTLERMIDGLEKDKEALRHKVAKCSDYEDVKRELEILKSIEFSTGDDDEDVLDFSSPTESAPQTISTPDKKETLEQLLLARNKKLGNELTVLRVSHQDLTTRLQTLQQTLDSATAELNTSRALNARLEDDLLKLQQESHNPHSSALSVAGTYVSRYQRSSIAGGSRPSPTSSIIGSHLDSQAPIPSSSNNNAGILPMITAQRDRFKAKNAELEQSFSAAQMTIANLRDEVASLQKDNLQLYEKTRYVSSYTAAASSGFAAANNNNNHGGIDRYRQAYEANISPFEAFRGRESARAYHRMRVPERIIYSFTRVILANRVSRNLFAAYCVLLHLLVGTMLYWSATGAVEGSIGMAATAAAVAAGGAGPGGGGGGGSEWKQEGFDGRL